MDFFCLLMICDVSVDTWHIEFLQFPEYAPICHFQCFQYCNDLDYKLYEKTTIFRELFQATYKVLLWHLIYQQSSDQNIGKMETLKMTKQNFQRPTFCKWLTYKTVICYHKVPISAYSRNCNYIFHMSSI